MDNLEGIITKILKGPITEPSEEEIVAVITWDVSAKEQVRIIDEVLAKEHLVIEFKEIWDQLRPELSFLESLQALDYLRRLAALVNDASDGVERLKEEDSDVNRERCRHGLFALQRFTFEESSPQWLKEEASIHYRWISEQAPSWYEEEDPEDRNEFFGSDDWKRDPKRNPSE